MFRWGTVLQEVTDYLNFLYKAKIIYFHLQWYSSALMNTSFTLCVFCTDNLISTRYYLKKKKISEVLYSAKDMNTKTGVFSTTVREPEF